MENIVITLQDMNEAEHMLGIEEGFSDEKNEVIKCLCSRDVVACPGSGKTTALLAKLLILAKKMPFDNNKGICVLTHTNVAVDEIREKLGATAKTILSYPNFIGTIQSFIDKYLAIPASIKYYGVRPIIIDTDVFNEQFMRMLNGRYPYFIKGFDFFCLRNRLSINELYLSMEEDCIYKGNKPFIFKTDADKRYEKLLKTIFRSLIKQGVLRYEMAFDVALRYIKDYEYELKTILSQRFRCVFIDEMQDTNSQQMDILEKTFDRGTIIFQCYGDPQQSIYNSFTQEGVWNPQSPLYIRNSMRFHDGIAKIADRICLEPYKMTGNGICDIPAIVITYTDKDKIKVLEKFARLIAHYKLNVEEKSVFKAVGMIKENDTLGISDYYPLFDKSNKRGSVIRDYPALHLYLNKPSDDLLKNDGVKIYYNSFLNALLKTIRLSDIKNDAGRYFTKTTLLKYIREQDERCFEAMNRFFARSILLIENEKVIIARFKKFFKFILKRIFHTELNSAVIDFFDKKAIKVDEDTISTIATNTFEFDDIQIQIDTVHGVKGQTHTATLYLETFYYQKSVESIIQYFCGERKKNLGARGEKYLKIAYVAMTRPQKLLCITMEDGVFEKNRDKLTEHGWVKFDEIVI